MTSKCLLVCFRLKEEIDAIESIGVPIVMFHVVLFRYREVEMSFYLTFLELIHLPRTCK